MKAFKSVHDCFKTIIYNYLLARKPQQRICSSLLTICPIIMKIIKKEKEKNVIEKAHSMSDFKWRALCVSANKRKLNEVTKFLSFV